MKQEHLGAIAFEGGLAIEGRGPRGAVCGTFAIHEPIVFNVGFHATLAAPGREPVRLDSRTAYGIPWLPRGRYRFELRLPGAIPAGALRVEVEARHVEAMQDRPAASIAADLANPVAEGGAEEPAQWHVEALAPTPSLQSLSWRRGHADWFFRHFDHAATTIISYLLGEHPALRGRILDVGCGDGITDLGIALRTRCTELVGIDPFHQFERLPQVLADNRLAAELIPANLRFMAEDANFLPFPDDSFDVVLSWGSVEHIAGGYLQALREMKRVLRPDGLLMIVPGLYYSNIGHHLTEFCTEPFFHLKKSREEIRRMVLETPPKYIDRAGEFSSNEQFFQWFTELNPITVTRFEQELRALEFRPWRVAIRTQDLVEYTPEIEHYPMQDLATMELYSSWVSTKRRRAP